jgi:hypothetical protein
MDIHLYSCLLCRDSKRINFTVQFCRFKGTLAAGIAQPVQLQNYGEN